MIQSLSREYTMYNKRHQQLSQALDHIVNTLIAQYEPEKIILFGSLASNNVKEWSDIDLAIIKNTPLPFLQRLKEVAILCQVRVGVDYLVYTPQEFNEMIADGNFFILDEIVDKGKVIYERQSL